MFELKCREDLPKILNQINAKIGVELGVLQGDFSKAILEEWKGDKLYLIDYWRQDPGMVDANNGDHNQQLNNMAQTFMNTYFFFGRCCIIKETSVEAAKLFQDESLNFIFIDAAHDFFHVTQDLEIWLPKIKKGGVMFGHDYVSGIWNQGESSICTNFEVKEAVDKFFKKLEIKVHNTQQYNPEEINPTWWIIK